MDNNIEINLPDANHHFITLKFPLRRISADELPTITSKFPGSTTGFR